MRAFPSMVPRCRWIRGGQRFYSGAAASGGSLPASAARLLFSLNEYSKPTESVAGPPGAVPQPVPVAQMVPVSPLAAPAADQARQQLADAGRRLSELLDEQWRQYLALPRDIYVPERTATYQTLVDALGRYDSVAADPRYAAVAQRPEFAAAHALSARVHQADVDERGPGDCPSAAAGRGEHGPRARLRNDRTLAS